MKWASAFAVLALLCVVAGARAQSLGPYPSGKPAPLATEPGFFRESFFTEDAFRLQPLPKAPTAFRQAGSDVPTDDKTNGKNGNGNGNDKEEKPPENIKDNSFLIEEAYNQEPGVVQHIFNWIHFWDQEPGRRSREFQFTQTTEIPIFSQTHQFSFVVPFQHFFEHVDGLPNLEEGGLGDMLVNYRLQLLTEDECGWRPAVAPRFSLILPTGDRERGLGNGEIGYQFNLPISKQWEPFAFHFNAGATYVPGVSVPLANGFDSDGRDLRFFNLGASVIWLVRYDFNFLLEAVVYFNESLDDLGARERTTEVILNPGFRWAVYTSDEVQWVLGLAAPIGISRDAPDYGVFGYMSVEHRFLKKAENGN